MATTERRYIPNKIEIRAKNESGIPSKIGGIAALVNTVTDMGWYEEKIEAGAFNGVLESSDIRCLFNHEDELILGRVKSGTLRCAINAEGHLEYECDIDPLSPTHVSAARAIERGDVDQSSFQFVARTTEWTHSEKYGEMGMRIIKEFDALYDVSPVTFPAYQETVAEARKVIEARDSEKLNTEKVLQNEINEQENYMKTYYNLIIS